MMSFQRYCEQTPGCGELTDRCLNIDEWKRE